MTLTHGDQAMGPEAFPGRQGRGAFAYLCLRRGLPVPREEVAEALWGADRPQSWSTALSAVASKLRTSLTELGLDGPAVIHSNGGCYEVRLPSGAWVDHEAAADSIHWAETSLNAGDLSDAYGASAVAHHIARRPFLPGWTGAWVEEQRERMRAVYGRALECRARLYLLRSELTLATEAARELVSHMPFRESGYRLLMQAHAEAGNSAQALRVYERCRSLISTELGVPPSPETRELHDRILREL